MTDWQITGSALAPMMNEIQQEILQAIKTTQKRRLISHKKYGDEYINATYASVIILLIIEKHPDLSKRDVYYRYFRPLFNRGIIKFIHSEPPLIMLKEEYDSVLGKYE